MSPRLLRMQKPPKRRLSEHQKLIVHRLQKGELLRAGLRRGSENQVLGIGTYQWYSQAGESLGRRVVTVDTLFSMRSSGIIRLEDKGVWSLVILND